jgi:hypothetical protein
MMSLTFWDSSLESTKVNCIKPSKSNVLSFLSNLREFIRKHPTIPVNDLIKILNPKLRGRANYYRHSVAKQVFGYVGINFSGSYGDVR